MLTFTGLELFPFVRVPLIRRGAQTKRVFT